MKKYSSALSQKDKPLKIISNPKVPPLEGFREAAYTIKENSWLAKIAAKKLGTDNVAMVLGSTIHLFNTSKNDFLKDERWVKHELCHIRQFKEHGYLLFTVKYLWESLRNGYYNNKYEMEARAAESL